MSLAFDCGDPEVRRALPGLLESLVVSLPERGRFSPAEEVQVYGQAGDCIHVPLFFARNNCGGLNHALTSGNDQIFPAVGSSKEKFEFTGELRAHQEGICQRVYQLLCQRGGAIIGATMGSGKTVMGAKMAGVFSSLGKVVVLVTNCNLATQWLKTFQSFTTARIAVYVKPGVKARIKYPGNKSLDVIIVKERSWLAAQSELGPGECGLLIVDEIHTYKRLARIKNLLGFKPRMCLFLSATYGGEAELLTKMIVGPREISLVLDPGEKRPSQIYYLHTGINFPMPQTDMGAVDWSRLVADVVGHSGRNALIVEIVKKHYLEHKILLVTWRNAEHAAVLSQNLQLVGIDNSLYSGNSRGYSDRRVLIGTISKLGVGFDEKAICDDFSGEPIDLVILVTSIKSHDLAEQVLGRAFRSVEPKMLVLVDENFLLRRHWQSISTHLQTRGAIIKRYWPDLPGRLPWKGDC